jgi:hypothetical protein
MYTQFSEKYNLIKADLVKIWKGFLIAFAGAVVAYLTSVTGLIDYSAYGQSALFAQSIVMIGSSTIVNALNKWLSTTEYTV